MGSACSAREYDRSQPDGAPEVHPTGYPGVWRVWLCVRCIQKGVSGQGLYAPASSVGRVWTACVPRVSPVTRVVAVRLGCGTPHRLSESKKCARSRTTDVSDTRRAGYCHHRKAQRVAKPPQAVTFTYPNGVRPESQGAIRTSSARQNEHGQVVRYTQHGPGVQQDHPDIDSAELPKHVFRICTRAVYCAAQHSPKPPPSCAAAHCACWSLLRSARHVTKRHGSLCDGGPVTLKGPYCPWSPVVASTIFLCFTRIASDPYAHRTMCGA